MTVVIAVQQDISILTKTIRMAVPSAGVMDSQTHVSVVTSTGKGYSYFYFFIFFFF